MDDGGRSPPAQANGGPQSHGGWSHNPDLVVYRVKDGPPLHAAASQQAGRGPSPRAAAPPQRGQEGSQSVKDREKDGPPA